MKNILIASHIVLFLLGFGAGLYLPKHDVPTTIWIEKDGETEAYADLSVETSKVLYVEGGDDPGAYLAFPIYSPRYPELPS